MRGRGVGANSPHGPSLKAARYAARQASRWGKKKPAARGRRDEDRALSHRGARVLHIPRSVAVVQGRARPCKAVQGRTKTPAGTLPSGRIPGAELLRPSVAWSCQVAPRSAARAALPRQRGAPDGGNHTPKTERPQDFLRSPAISRSIAFGLLCCGLHNPSRLHCSEPAPRGNNAAGSPRRGRWAWM